MQQIERDDFQQVARVGRQMLCVCNLAAKRGADVRSAGLVRGVQHAEISLVLVSFDNPCPLVHA